MYVFVCVNGSFLCAPQKPPTNSINSNKLQSQLNFEMKFQRKKFTQLQQQQQKKTSPTQSFYWHFAQLNIFYFILFFSFFNFFFAKHTLLLLLKEGTVFAFRCMCVSVCKFALVCVQVRLLPNCGATANSPNIRKFKTCRPIFDSSLFVLPQTYAPSLLLLATTTCTIPSTPPHHWHRHGNAALWCCHFSLQSDGTLGSSCREHD